MDCALKQILVHYFSLKNKHFVKFPIVRSLFGADKLKHFRESRTRKQRTSNYSKRFGGDLEAVHPSSSTPGVEPLLLSLQVEQFRNTSGAIVDAFIRCKYSSAVANRWLAIRLEMIGNFVVSTILPPKLFRAVRNAVVPDFLRRTLCRHIKGTRVGDQPWYHWSVDLLCAECESSYRMYSTELVRTSQLPLEIQVTEVLNFAVRQVSELEANIVAVERIDEYTNTPTEVLHSILFHRWTLNVNEPCRRIPSNDSRPPGKSLKGSHRQTGQLLEQ